MLQPSVLWMLWGQCSAVCSGCLCPLAWITLVPVGTASLAMLDHCPEACIPPVPMVLAVQDHRGGDQVGQRSGGRCWRTVGLQSHILLVSHSDRRVSPLCPLLLRSQALLTASCLLFWCLHVALARDTVSPHVQVTGKAEKGLDGWYGTSLKVLLSQGREGICWGMLVPTVEVLDSEHPKCCCLIQRLPGRWEASPHPR